MRCPNCGSKMIYPGTEHKHFSGGKAVAGMVAFGVIGGAAGFIGKDTKGYRCSACGAFCQETMPFGTESAINSAVNAAKHNHDFAQYNLFRETYQNLEPIIPVGDHTALQTGLILAQTQAHEQDAPQIKRTYQPNAYVCDCPIFVEAVLLKTRDDQDFLSLAARNKSTNTIRSAYIDVKVLDDAGDPIAETNCVFQGLAVSAGEYLPIDKEFPLNTDLAFKVEFQCVKVTFVDDTVWRDEGQPVHLLAEQDVITEENFAKYKALQLKFAENRTTKDAVMYQPVVTEHYVQCVCGHPFNPGERCYHCGRDVDAIGALISFDVLDQYEKEIIKQRAQARYKECQEFKNGALARQYALALSLMKEQDISTLEEAHALFTLLGDYQDAKAQAALCYERKTQLEETQAKEEAARLAAERKAEEDRLAREKSKKKKRKILISVAASVACVAIAFVVLLNTVIIPTMQRNDEIEQMDFAYDNAVALIDEGNYCDAYEALMALDGYKDSIEKAKSIYNECVTESLKNAQVGSRVYFGTYEQDNDLSNGEEFIEWIVLETKGKKALVISKYALDWRQFHPLFEDVTWEECALREWLNDSFIHSAFTADEIKKIPTMTVPADQSPYSSLKSGNSTKDKVFLLSRTEVETYFKEEKDRVCEATEYAYAQGVFRYAGGCEWWLRTREYHSPWAATVTFEGVRNGGRVDATENAVRPALWIDLSQID